MVVTRGLGNTAVAPSTNWWQSLIALGAQTGANIANAQWATVPVYQQTATPYGTSTNIYQPGVSPVPGTNVVGGGGMAAMGSGTILLIGGGLLLVMMMNKG